jgi:hypothetical protein
MSFFVHAQHVGRTPAMCNWGPWLPLTAVMPDAGELGRAPLGCTQGVTDLGMAAASRMRLSTFASKSLRDGKTLRISIGGQ